MIINPERRISLRTGDINLKHHRFSIEIRYKKDDREVSLADLSKSKNLLLSKMGDFKRLIIWVFGVEPKTQDLAAKAQKSKP